MHVLMVLPATEGSGEATTAVAAARELERRGHRVAFLGSAAALRLADGVGGALRLELPSDPGAALQAWRHATKAPVDVVLFADYHLLHFPDGGSGLARAPGWIEALRSCPAALLSLDHFGWGREGRTLHLGPPHLGTARLAFPALPDGMRVLLPCPMHDPSRPDRPDARRFRVWGREPPLPPDARARERARWGADGRAPLIVHPIAQWAVSQAEAHGLVLHAFLGDLLVELLRGMPEPPVVVTVGPVAVAPRGDPGSVRFRHAAGLPAADFDRLVRSADLFLTENAVSLYLGRAAAAAVPAAALVNPHRLLDARARADGSTLALLREMEAVRSGSVFPFAAFPVLTPGDVREIGLLEDNPLAGCVEQVPLFGGATSAARLAALVSDSPERRRLERRQRAYIDALGALPSAAEAIERAAAAAR